MSPYIVAVPEVGFPCNHAGLRTRRVAMLPMLPGDTWSGREGVRS